MALLDRIFASVYDRILAPAEHHGLAGRRHALLADLSGTVVEIGAGTGLNLAHYPDAVTHVSACEPSPEMATHLRTRAASDPRVEVIEAPGEALPLADASVDHAVATLVLCTVGDVERTAVELARVVRPGGTLRLVEHVGAADGGLALIQRIVEPVWKVAARGCHITRNPIEALERAGFDTSGVGPWSLPGAVGLMDDAISGVAVRRP